MNNRCSLSLLLWLVMVKLSSLHLIVMIMTMIVWWRMGKIPSLLAGRSCWGKKMMRMRTTVTSSPSFGR